MVHTIKLNDNNIVYFTGRKSKKDAFYYVITMGNNKIVVEDSLSEKDNYSGEYIKEKELTLDDIINLKYPIY